MKAMTKVMLCSLACLTQLSARIYLEDVMSQEEQLKTGVYNLNHDQKLELENWINNTFVLKNSTMAPNEEPIATLTFDLVLANGKFVQLSDQSLYEISPDDIPKTAVWLLPFPIALKASGNADYPVLLVNQNTGESVKGKKVSVSPQSTQMPNS